MHALKGDVSMWIWVVGGLIIGASVILFATTMAVGFFKSYQENAMRERYLMLASRIEAVCSGGEGNMDYFSIAVSDVVRAVYPARNQFERPPEKVSEMISDRETGSGDFLCLSYFEKNEPSCKKLKCQIEMEYFGTPSMREDLFTLLAKIRGDYPIYTYSLIIEKAEGKVYVTREAPQTNISLQGVGGVETLATCDGNPVLVSTAGGKLLVFGDATLWVKGNAEFAKLLAQAHSYLGNGSVLVIYEDDNAMPDGLTRIKETIEPWSIWIKHEMPLSHMFQTYSQVWIVRPGWCEAEFREGEDVGCANSTAWEDSEIKALGDYVKGGGHVFIITDYQASGTGDKELLQTPARVVNGFLDSIGAPFKLAKGYVCRKSYLKAADDSFQASGRIDIRYASVWERMRDPA